MAHTLYFGTPEPDYNFILDLFSETKVRTIRTSTVPLVQFWKQTEQRLNELSAELNIDCKNQKLCFEYPTNPTKGMGKSSMTDLMILCENNTKVAIEAKYTEYVKTKTNSVGTWKKTGTISNKKIVLESWIEMIKPFSKNLNNIDEIDYQFFHRTASACYNSKNANVVYLLFYDKNTINFLPNYLKELKKYITDINPNNNLSFYIWEIEIELIKPLHNNPFVVMKSYDVYNIYSSKLYKI